MHKLFQLETSLKIFAAIIAVLIGEIESFEVFDRSSDKLLFSLLSHEDVALSCCDVFKYTSTVPLLLANKDCQMGLFAKCEDGSLHKNFKRCNCDEHSIVNYSSRRTRRPPCYTEYFIRRLPSPMKVLAPGIRNNFTQGHNNIFFKKHIITFYTFYYKGKILLVGEMTINGFHYERGVWEVYLEDRETIVVNNFLIVTSTTNEDLGIYEPPCQCRCDNFGSSVTTKYLGENLAANTATSKFQLNLYCLFLLITFSSKIVR